MKKGLILLIVLLISIPSFCARVWNSNFTVNGTPPPIWYKMSHVGVASVQASGNLMYLSGFNEWVLLRVPRGKLEVITKMDRSEITQPISVFLKDPVQNHSIGFTQTFGTLPIPPYITHYVALSYYLNGTEVPFSFSEAQYFKIIFNPPRAYEAYYSENGTDWTLAISGSFNGNTNMEYLQYFTTEGEGDTVGIIYSTKVTSYGGAVSFL